MWCVAGTGFVSPDDLPLSDEEDEEAAPAYVLGVVATSAALCGETHAVGSWLIYINTPVLDAS